MDDKKVPPSEPRCRPQNPDAGDTANTEVSIYDYGDKCIVFDTRGLDVSKSSGKDVAASHLGNISYNIGERNTVSASELKDAVSGIKSLDDNTATMDRTVEHLESNGVDLSKYPVALGPHLQFDPKTEKFSNNDKANEMLTREYRSGF